MRRRATARCSRCRSTSTARTGSGCRKSALEQGRRIRADRLGRCLPRARQAQGRRPDPAGVQRPKDWERNLFNAVLVGKGGNALWAAIYGKRDPAAAKSAAFKAVAETYGKLRGYVDAGAPGRNWNDATNLVIQGKAGMQIMGDWAKGEFAAAGQTAGKEFDCTILSKEGGYVMGGDVFAFPKSKDPAQQKAQLLLAKSDARSRNPDPLLAEERLDPGPARSRHQFARRLRPEGDEAAGRQDPSGPPQELLAPPAFTGAMEDWSRNTGIRHRRRGRLRRQGRRGAEGAVLTRFVSLRDDRSLASEGGSTCLMFIHPRQTRTDRQKMTPIALRRRGLASRAAGFWRCRRRCWSGRGLCRLHRLDHVDLAHGARGCCPTPPSSGLRQYASLMGNERWQVSVVNLVVFGALFMPRASRSASCWRS